MNDQQKCKAKRHLRTPAARKLGLIDPRHQEWATPDGEPPPDVLEMWLACIDAVNAKPRSGGRTPTCQCGIVGACCYGDVQPFICSSCYTDQQELDGACSMGRGDYRD